MASKFAPGRLGAQTALTFGLKIWTAAASFGVSWLIAREFGAAGSGRFGIAISTLTILTYVALAGLDNTLVRIAAGDLRENNRAGARGAIVSGGIAVLVISPLLIGILWLFRQTFAVDVLGQPDMAPLLGIMLWVAVPLALQRIASAGLRASNRVMISQLFDGPVGTTLTLAGMIIAILTVRNSLLVSAWLYLGGIAVGCVVAWLVIHKTWRGWPEAARPAILPMLVAGLPILASNISGLFTEWFTTVSLGASWPAEVVGQYRAAWQFVAILGLVQIAMDSIIGPRIAAAARVGAKHEIALVARKSLLLALGMASPLFVVLIIFPEKLLGIFGQEFRGGALALQILAIGQIIRLASGPLGTILVMTGNQRWVLAYAGFGVLLCIAFVVLLVPVYGAVGAALATGATIILRNAAAAVIVHRVLGINLFRRQG